MKLTRLRIQAVRKFRQPLEIDGFNPGINLFTGPNGSGKSTIIRAIRAVFLERYRSSSVDDLRPWGDSSAAPTVELEFETDGATHQLIKSFLQRKRCDLRIDNRQLAGDEAEQYLADLLGFQFSGSGGSKPRHWGIPGLLWIEQGTGQDVSGAVGHATDHLRSALNESLGEIAASGGDDILEQVRKLRAELLTAGGKPRGRYADVIRAREELSGQLAGLNARIDTYRQQVDSLASLQAEQATETSQRPWDEFREQQREVAARLEAIHQRSRNLEQERRRLQQCVDNIGLRQEQLAGFEHQERQLAQRALALDTAREALRQAQADEQRMAPQRQTAEAAYRAARETLRVARQWDRNLDLQQRAETLREQLVALERTLAAAGEHSRRLAQLRQQAQASIVEQRDLDVLRLQDRRLRELRIRRAAIASRLRFELEPGRSLYLDQQLLSGSGEQLLLDTARIDIPGFGRLDITPGGDDLAGLAREQEEILEAHQVLLERLGVASLEAAERRFVELERLRADCRQTEQAYAHCAPEGLDALTAERDRLLAAQRETEAMLSEIHASLADSPAADSGQAPVSLPLAEAALDRCRDALDAATAQASGVLQTLSAAQAGWETAQREHQAILELLEDTGRRQRQSEISQQLLELKAECDALQQRIEAGQLEIDAARPDMLELDLKRLGNAVEQTEKQYQERRLSIRHLQGQLEEAGSQGLEERRAEIAVEAAHIERRHTELTSRAAALDLLLNLLEDKRKVLTRRLQAPLQAHLNHYLQLLFPQASIEIDENLTLGSLNRSSPQGPEAGSFDQQSFGTREQLGLISRLAYADLLRAAGRPTLIILDDALVHSDQQRLGQMKRILFDAAQRHQILLFTCHPHSWQDLGAAPRSLEALSEAAGGT